MADGGEIDLLAALQKSLTKGRAEWATFESGGPVPVGTGPSKGLLQQIPPTAVLPSDKDYYREQAAFIETLAGHLANGRIATGQRYGSTRQLLQAVQTLAAWQEDDRS